MNGYLYVVIILISIFLSNINFQRKESVIKFKFSVKQDFRTNLIQKYLNLLNNNSSIPCPTFKTLATVPNQCQTTTPKYENFHNSSLFPIYNVYPPHSAPGPSAQTNGLRHVIMAAISLGKSLLFSHFSTHSNDESSKKNKVPFGLRIDVAELCKLMVVKSDYEEGLKLENRTKRSLQKERMMNMITNQISHPFEHQKSLTSLTHREQYRITKILSLILCCENSSSCEVDKCDPKLYTREADQKKIVRYLKEFTKIEANSVRKAVNEMIPIQGLAYDMIPTNLTERQENRNEKETRTDPDLEKVFLKNKIRYNEPAAKIIGIANPHKWIYKSMHNLIDKGGTYRAMDTVNASGLAPNYTIESAEQELSTNYTIVRDVYKYTRHPLFIKLLAVKFIRTYFKTFNYVGVHWLGTKGPRSVSSKGTYQKVGL